MEELLLVAGTALLLVMLHAAVAAYLYRAVSSESADGPRTASEYIPDPDRDREPTGEVEERVSCPACGTPNDPSYRFCRLCVSDLSSSVSSGGGANGRGQLGS